MQGDPYPPLAARVQFQCGFQLQLWAGKLAAAVAAAAPGPVWSRGPAQDASMSSSATKAWKGGRERDLAKGLSGSVALNVPFCKMWCV